MNRFHGVEFEVVGDPFQVADKEIVKTERDLGCSLPSSYREFVQTYGYGEFESICLRILRPSSVVSMLRDDQNGFKDYWFWDDSPEVWTQAKAIESIACFDGEGHGIRFHPSDPSVQYFLSHDDSTIEKFDSFSELIEFMRNYGGDDGEGLAFTPMPPQYRT